MSYRDDLAALESRVDALRTELAQTESLAQEARALVRQRVIEAEIATPCAANWEDMVGDDRVRHCKLCAKNVYNFAELTRDDIDALIVKYEGTLCGRLFKRADGTILTKDCTRDIVLRPSRASVGLGVAVAAAASLAVGYKVFEQFDGRTSFGGVRFSYINEIYGRAELAREGRELVEPVEEGVAGTPGEATHDTSGNMISAAGPEHAGRTTRP